MAGMKLDNSDKYFACRADNVKEAAKGNVVLNGCQVVPQGSPDMTVDVNAGNVYINGVAVPVAAVDNQAITAADATNPRLDIIEVGVNGTVDYTAGTPAANPLPPNLAVDHVLLSIIDVQANDTEISAGEILDERLIDFENALTAVLPFGGDGTDGALTVSSGTTNLTPNNWYQYSSVAITGTGVVSIASNGAGLSGTVLIKCSGDATLTSSGDAISLAELGATGGAGGNPGVTGTAGGMTGQTAGGGAIADAGGTAGAAATEASVMQYPPAVYGANFISLNNKSNLLSGVFGPGSGGGGGNETSGASGGGGGGSAINAGDAGSGNNNTGGGVPGDGGIGGAAILMEVKGDFTFTSTIDVSGEDGEDAASGQAGGGGGGAGGTAYIIVAGAVTDSGSKTFAGGTKGAGSSGQAGGDGGDGQVLIVKSGDVGNLY